MAEAAHASPKRSILDRLIRFCLENKLVIVLLTFPLVVMPVVLALICGAYLAFWGEMLVRYRDDKGAQQLWDRLLSTNTDPDKVNHYRHKWLQATYHGGDYDLVLAGGRVIMTKTLISADSGHFALFIDSVLRGEHSIVDLLTADYTFLNERLAMHYGIG